MKSSVPNQSLVEIRKIAEGRGGEIVVAERMNMYDQCYVNVTGTLDDYFRALSASGVTVTFVQPSIFNEDSFLVQHDDRQSDENDTLDLRKVLVELKQFSQHIGSSANLELFAFTGSLCLRFNYSMPWYLEFEEIIASKQIEIDHALAKDVAERIRGAKAASNALEAKIFALRGDAVIRFKVVKERVTLRALTSYIAEKYFTLEQVEDRTFKSQITKLRDFIITADK